MAGVVYGQKSGGGEATAYQEQCLLSTLKPALTALATAMTHSVMQGDTEAALAFLQCYSSHHQREEADLLLNRLGKTADMIEYDQKIKGFTL
ncbi:hypothetical protein [Pantoea vagans]|uniref:hypothetical protein n=1 Tax=Pantoea vagans TaxID=470934 RepID=UPI003208336C